MCACGLLLQNLYHSTLLCGCHLSHDTGISVSLLILHPDTRLKVLTGSQASGKLLTAYVRQTLSISHSILGICLTWVATEHLGSSFKDKCSVPTGCQSQHPWEARPLLLPQNNWRLAPRSPELRNLQCPGAIEMLLPGYHKTTDVGSKAISQLCAR